MENSNFNVIADLGNFRYRVECHGCGHDFAHRAGQENSHPISATLACPKCPVCGMTDPVPDPVQSDEMTAEEAFNQFHMTLAQTDQKALEPWTIYDVKSRQAYSSREGCINEGKVWLEQDIRGNEFNGTLTERQVLAIRLLFPEKASELLGYCRHS